MKNSEYTDWHLTPFGWSRGYTKVDGERPVGSTPERSVAVFRYERWGRERLRNALHLVRVLVDDDAVVVRLLREHGPCPRHL